MKYYLAENIDEKDWINLLDFAFQEADSVEFNLLYQDEYLEKVLDSFSQCIVFKQPKRKSKIYSSGSVLRLEMTNKVRTFIEAKSFSDWMNSPLEDISFLQDGNEFLATITHEGYVIAQLTEDKREALKKEGINFQYEWNNIAQNKNAT